GLNNIMNDYGISVFSVNVIAKGLNVTGQTSYSESITGMIALSVQENYGIIGLILLAIIIAAFIKKNPLKIKKSL
ncbi:MAG: hypothetical protein PHG04_02295, partial [Candidatus Nanoarchaeia archaeon]|nr:hypothetical protein [Candidatus Nanoarchaeia archaeon]MDD5054188.1 hypothetical protein [Candidatus Nanoarchaeia archaeon]